MIAEGVALAAIAGMSVVTYVSRIGGLWLMAFVPLTDRVAGALKALSGSVLIALVVPATLQGDAAMRFAVVASVCAMAVTGRTIPSMLLGVAVAAGHRHLA